MNNREQYVASPEDEDAVRRKMREKCIGKFKFEKLEVEAFFANSVQPALNAFAFQADPATIDPEGFQIAMDNMTNASYHEGELNGVPYGAFSLGVRVTTKDRRFYYRVYAMSPDWKPLGPYCVFIKSDGECRTIEDLETCSGDALFDDVKRFFLETKAEVIAEALPPTISIEDREATAEYIVELLKQHDEETRKAFEGERRKREKEHEEL